MDLYKYENELKKQNYKYIAGTDEAGRGSMAGPLVVAAVILPSDEIIEGLNDSKQLTSKKRAALYNEIIEKAIEYKIEIINVSEVDRLNVYQASKQGMEKCIQKMKSPVDFVLSDAIQLELEIPNLSLIKGDAKSASIAAASIIAKVTRDNIMIELAKKYPEYGFDKHKGYVTKHHLEMLELHGPTEIHRRSFAPVERALYKQTSFDL